MPAEDYENYGFTRGDEITCKIDRINCTGRIFLEPKHPRYEEGEFYYFEVINNSNHDNENVLKVKEISGNIVEVPVNSILKFDINEQKMVRCIVKSIKKGRLILEIHPDYA